MWLLGILIGFIIAQGMHDMNFFQPIWITDNYPPLMIDTDKITDIFVF